MDEKKETGSPVSSLDESPPNEPAYVSDDSLDADDAPPPYADDTTSTTSTSRTATSYPDEKGSVPPKSASLDNETSSLSANTLVSSDTNEADYGFYYPRLTARSLVILHDATRTPVYYAEVSEFTPRKPDVLLRSFPTPIPPHANLEQLMPHGAGGPIAGLCWIPTFSRNYRACLGDPEDQGGGGPLGRVPSGGAAGGGEWILVENPSMVQHAEYRFAWRGMRFAWRRTRDPTLGVEGGKVKRVLTLDSYELQHTASGEGVAVFVEDKWGKVSKRGRLRLLKDLDSWSPAPDVGGSAGGAIGKGDVLLMIFVTATGLVEKARRRANARRARYSGGGG